MAWAHVQDAPGSDGTGGAAAGNVSTGPFVSPVTLNNIVAVFCWGDQSSLGTAGQITCSDNGSTPNTYTQLAFKSVSDANADDVFAAIFIATITHNPSSGNLNPKVTAANGLVVVACAAEFSGGSTTVDGSAVVASSGSTGAPAPGSLTPNFTTDLILAVMASGATGATTVTTPTNFTSCGKHSTGADTLAGEGIWFIPGNANAQNPTWPSQANGWDACQVDVKVAGGAAAQPPIAAFARQAIQLLEQGGTNAAA